MVQQGSVEESRVTIISQGIDYCREEGAEKVCRTGRASVLRIGVLSGLSETSVTASDTGSTYQELSLICCCQTGKGSELPQITGDPSCIADHRSMVGGTG